MDFGLREWLLILGPVFIVIVLVHGYLRMRASRNNLKMALDKDFISKPGEEHDDLPDDNIAMLRAELPNGGARVRKVPEQGKLDLEEDVPVLMEPVEIGRKGEQVDDLPPIKATEAEEDEAEPEAAPDAHAGPRDSGPRHPGPEYFIVLYVVSVGEPFDGQTLLESLVELDMQFGEMDIFHHMGEDGRARFSLVNAVEPGTFELASMAGMQTPAVSLFMRAHELDAPLEAFDEMLAVARSLADELGGEVRDESKSVLTPQTTEHCRDEIRAYRRKYA